MFFKLSSLIFSKRSGNSLLQNAPLNDLSVELSKCYTYNRQITSLFQYKDTVVRELIHEMKYYNNKKAYEFFSHIIQKHILHLQKHAPVHITTIPISKRRFSEKGFNHMDILCRHISNHQSITYHKLLIKNRHTKRQAHIKNRQERKSNLDGVFEIKKGSCRPDHIFLIDDVYTTGTTILEAKKVLQKNGSLVTCITITH